MAENASQRVMPLPHRDIFPCIRRKVRETWQVAWESNVDRNQKMLEITNSAFPWTYDTMPRRWETALCRLRIGHSRLTHGHLTIRHLLIDCPRLRAQRNCFLLDCRNADGNFDLSKILIISSF